MKNDKAELLGQIVVDQAIQVKQLQNELAEANEKKDKYWKWFAEEQDKSKQNLSEFDALKADYDKIREELQLARIRLGEDASDL